MQQNLRRGASAAQPLVLASALLVAAALVASPARAEDSLAWPFGKPSVDAAAAPVQPQRLNAAGEGRRLFLKLNCYGCHGIRGGGGMGPSLAGAPEAAVRGKVQNGSENGMRSFRTVVTSTDLTNLVAYVQTLGLPGEPTFTHWWETTPSR